MNITKDSSFLQALEMVKTTYDSMFNEIGVVHTIRANPQPADIESDIDTQFKPNLCHNYSSCNLDERIGNIQKVLESMKSSLQQHKQWENEKELPKLLTTERQYHITNYKVKQIQKSISDCGLLGKGYLDHLASYQNTMYNTPNTNKILGKRRLALVSCKLQDFTNDLSVKYGVFSIIDELISLNKTDLNTIAPDSVHSCNIAAPTFIVDIYIFGDGTIKEVDLHHISIITDEIIPKSSQDLKDDLTRSLKSFTKDREFETKIRKLCQQDTLLKKFKSYNLQTILFNIQEDFQNISNFINDKYSNIEDLYKSYGKITMDYCGVKFNYYQTLQQRMMGENGFILHLEMEEGIKNYNLSSIHQLDTSLTNGMNDDNESNNNNILNCTYLLNTTNEIGNNKIITSPVRLILKLEPAVNLTVETLQRIQSIIGVSDNENKFDYATLTTNCSGAINYQSYLENQIIGSRERSKTPLSHQFDNQVLGEKQRYFFSGQYNIGLEVYRIPIEHQIQILPIIQILRQQISFNLLFKSCFTIQQCLQNDPSTDPTNSSASSTSMELDNQNSNQNNNTSIPVFEVSSNPPYSLNITFLHPIKNQFHSLDIEVEIGGVIKATIDDSSIASNTYISNLLNTSKSIPITFHYLFNTNN